MYDYNVADQLFSLMRIDEETYRAASFLDHRINKFQCPVVHYELRHLAGVFPRLNENRKPLRFIFHVGHCGSTLLSRALAASQKVLPFREPVTLRSLSADQRDLGTPLSMLPEENWSWLLTTVLDTLARSFRADQVNVIKATSSANNLILPILEEHEAHRAVLLYIPLESYLATMLADSASGGDLKGQARKRMLDWLKIDTDTDLAIHALDNPRLAALSWLTSMNYMLAAMRQHTERLLMVDFEEFLADPPGHLDRIAAFLGLREESRSIVEGYAGIAGRYSKNPDAPFGAGERSRKLNLSREKRAGDIKEGIMWAESRVRRISGLEDCARYFS